MSDNHRKDMHDIQKQQLTSEIGSLAHVRREQVTSEESKTANRELRAIGDLLKPVKNNEYLGSSAVHIYKLEALDEVIFVSQTQPLGETPEVLGAKAFDDLKNRAMEHYGRKAPKLRSGF
jgi:hypothetical protein